LKPERLRETEREIDWGVWEMICCSVQMSIKTGVNQIS
jgi:hypothetical protein